MLQPYFIRISDYSEAFLALFANFAMLYKQLKLDTVSAKTSQERCCVDKLSTVVF